MNSALQILHWLAGLVVVAEALNKLERTAPCAPGLNPHTRLVAALKAAAWALLAIGGGGAVATPLLQPAMPGLAETAVLLGFAILIVRTRIKEG